LTRDNGSAYVFGVKGVIFLIVGGVTVCVFSFVVNIIGLGVVTAWNSFLWYIDDRRFERRKFSDGRVAFMFFWVI